MRKRTLITLAGMLTAIGCCYIAWFSTHPVLSSGVVGVRDLAPPAKITQHRLSVAFILGEDNQVDNPYYSEALRYYTTNAEGKTDFVVNTCRSLTDVKDYLKKNRPANGNPWGDVHLVSHGNQWTGLSVKVAPDSKRATVQRIVDYTQSGLFELLNQTVVDAKTKIFLHSCGVGNNSDLVDAIRTFFGSKNGQPMMFAPKLFEYYASVGSEKNLQSERYMAQSWFVNYPMGDKPSSHLLTNELREKYTDTPVNWQSALSRDQPRWIGDVYHYTFEVPVKWVIPVDSIPGLTEESQQRTWLCSQQQIANELKALQIPVEKFKWSFSNGYTETQAGLKTRAIYIKGYCTMLCVLQVLTDTHSDHSTLPEPFVSELTDASFYYSAAESKLAGI